MTVLEEGLIRLNEEELFGPRTIAIEESEVITNMGHIQLTVANIIDKLAMMGKIYYNDEKDLLCKELTCINTLGEILQKLEGY